MTSLTNANTLRQLRQAVQTSDSGGKANTIAERFHHLKNLVEIGGVHTLEPLLPLCLSLNGKPYELSDHFAFSPFYKTRMPSQMVVVSGRQVSKTVAVSPTAYVSLENGSLVSGIDVKVGDRVLSVNSGYRTVIGVVTDKIDSGVKQVVRVTTRKGSVVDIATTHPLKKLDRWATGGELRVGDRVAALRSGGVFGSRPLTDRVILTAYMLGDGYCSTRSDVNLTKKAGPVVEEFTRLANHYEQQGVRTHRKSGNNAALQIRIHGDNSIRQWMREDQLEGKLAHQKFIPPWVFDLSRSAAVVFLSRLWATDGCITTAENGTPSITYSTTSPRLAADVRAMLTKFGIPTTIAVRDAGYKDAAGNFVQCHNANIVRVETRTGWETFFDTFDVPGKAPVPIPATEENNNRDTIPIEVQGLITELCEACGRRKGSSLHAAGLRKTLKYAPTFGKALQYLTHFEQHCPQHPRLPELRALLDNDITWDEITAVERLGEQRCWDIEVSSEHNYVLNGLMSHNSTSLAAHGVILSNSIPYFRTLFVTPLYEQIRRFSNNYVSSFINQSPVKSLWTGTTTKNSVLSKTFRNNSSMTFSFTGTDCDRIRGISADCLNLDEVQDFDSDHFPIIRETMSYSKWALTKFAGTPKSTDNTINGLWKRSSQAEWMIPCNHCKEWNIPSLEFHLEDMLGPLRTDISEEFPGTVCHKCRKPIRPREGHWVHRYKERRWDFAGYHVPQVIMPLHYSSYKKWDELLAKQRGWGNYTQARFYNEVLGESVDAGQQLVSETELKRAASLPWKNNPNQPDQNVTARLQYYTTRVLAVDWGGGGEAGVSFTTMALLGFAPDGKIHCLWGKRLVASQEHLREAKELLHWTSVFAPDVVVHDYTGAGVVREAVLVQAGFNLDRIMPIEYVRAGIGNMLRYIEPSVLHNRGRYRLDKTRSLLWTCQAIKLGMLQFFEYDYVNDDNPGLMHDFLALVEEKTESRMAGDIYTIVRNQMLSDDFAQAVNIGCCALWHINQAWPNFAQAAALGQISLAGLQAYDGDSTEWDDRRGTSGILATP